jgi:hypothetical protein
VFYAHGGLTNEQNDKVLKDFLAHKGRAVLVSSDKNSTARSLQFGYNKGKFQYGATHLHHYSLPDNNATIQQRNARQHRKGAQVPVKVHTYSAGTPAEIRSRTDSPRSAARRASSATASSSSAAARRSAGGSSRRGRSQPRCRRPRHDGDGRRATAVATATLWAMLQHGIIGAAVFVARLTTLVVTVAQAVARRPRARQPGPRGPRRHPRRRRGAVARRSTRPRRPRFARIEGTSRRQGRPPGGQPQGRQGGGVLDVLGAHERQEIRSTIAAAYDREKQRPEGQPERRTTVAVYEYRCPEGHVTELVLPMADEKPESVVCAGRRRPLEDDGGCRR